MGGEDQDFKDWTAEQYGSLAWYHLFNRQFTEAETAARRGIALGGEAAEWIHTNLALSLLYQGKYEEAEAVYLEFKGQMYDEEQSWGAIFLKDLDELEAAGITHPDVAKIRKLLKP